MRQCVASCLCFVSCGYEAAELAVTRSTRHKQTRGLRHKWGSKAVAVPLFRYGPGRVPCARGVLAVGAGGGREMCVVCVWGGRGATQSTGRPEPVWWTESLRPQGEWQSCIALVLEWEEETGVCPPAQSSTERRMKCSFAEGSSMTASPTVYGRRY